MYPLWTYPPTRYYYDWYDAPPPPPSDHEIKSTVVDRLRENPHTKDDDITVDVEQSVVVLGGRVSARRWPSGPPATTHGTRRAW